MCFFSRRALVFRTTALVTLSRSHGLSSLRVQDLLVKEAPSGGSSFEVLNPATEEVLARLPDLGREDALRAIDVAEGAFEAFSRRTTSRERSRLLRRFYDAVTANEDELATLMTLESGKPKKESLGEVRYGASFLEWFAEEGPRAVGRLDTGGGPLGALATSKKAVGVAAMITPWNFPLAMITRKCGAALAVGCPVVVKPAEDTPLTALALAQLAEEIYSIPGVFNVVPCGRHNAKAVGDAFCESTKVRALSFTGSTAVGKELYAKCAGTVKKLGLELGGNAPFLVLSDADLDVAVECAMASKFRNAGQTCVSADRFIIQGPRERYDAFREKLAAKIRADLVLGNPMDPTTTVGPLISKRAADRVRAILKRSDFSQVEAFHEAEASRLGANFVAPTIVDVPLERCDETACWSTENFGPVVPLTWVPETKKKHGDLDSDLDDDLDLVELANRGETGLASYVVSRDLRRAWRVADKLDTGMCGINQGVISTASAPFGGVKESGLGREGGMESGLAEYLEEKYLCFGAI
mmetsp:Transcript_33696/g.107671  ORF Transcript_33696/g.107671 Transcript_33696/m.107671 type:complete len:526 (+) Transcript_33696:4487-6064(+)